jgi:glycosyltransferase involved in cell wall biosynthesis
LANVPIGFYSAQNIRKQYPWPIARCERYVYDRASFAFPVSSTVSNVLRQKGYRGACAVLPLGIDTDFYRPDAAKRRDGSPEGPLTVGYVGRITREKGLETLISAMRLMEGQNVRALIAGDGPAAADLKHQVSTLGLGDRVTWLGYVSHDQTPDVYQRMDVLVVPSRTVSSWKEQFGRVVIEALACGVPVVTADSGELPRLVCATGGGWTFPEGSAPALAAVLRGLVGRRPDLRDRGIRGRAIVCEQFDLDALAGRFITCVEAAAGFVGAPC